MGNSPECNSLSIPDSELHHIGHLAKKCCSLKPVDRPDLHEIIEQLCDPIFQLVMGVTTLILMVPVLLVVHMHVLAVYNLILTTALKHGYVASMLMDQRLSVYH